LGISGFMFVCLSPSFVSHSFVYLSPSFVFAYEDMLIFYFLVLLDCFCWCMYIRKHSYLGLVEEGGDESF